MSGIVYNNLYYILGHPGYVVSTQRAAGLSSSAPHICLAFMCLRRFYKDFKVSEAEPPLLVANEVKNGHKDFGKGTKDFQTSLSTTCVFIHIAYTYPTYCISQM